MDGKGRPVFKSQKNESICKTESTSVICIASKWYVPVSAFGPLPLACLFYGNARGLLNGNFVLVRFGDVSKSGLENEDA